MWRPHVPHIYWAILGYERYRWTCWTWAGKDVEKAEKWKTQRINLEEEVLGSCVEYSWWELHF